MARVSVPSQAAASLAPPAVIAGIWDISHLGPLFLGPLFTRLPLLPQEVTSPMGQAGMA